MVAGSPVVDEANSMEPARKELTEIFDSLQDINLDGKIVDIEPEQLGLGFSCDVFRAKCTTIGNKIVAIKRIRFFLLDDISFAKNLGREVRLWSKLRHPNILPLLGYFLEGPKAIPNLVSEWMKNGTVIDYTKRFSLDAMKMVQMVLGISSGLAYMHNEQDMIHADLKGSNILVSDDGRPLLADFGLSVSSSSVSLGATTFHGQKGSLRWMAKELHLISPDSTEFPKHTKMTDMWSFGMVISELLTRQVPYASIGDRLVPGAILGGMLPQEPDYREFPSSFIFRGLWSIARNCWNDDSLMRPAAQEIQKELSEFSYDPRTQYGGFISSHSALMISRPDGVPNLLDPIQYPDATRDVMEGTEWSTWSPFSIADSKSHRRSRKRSLVRHRQPDSNDTESMEDLIERTEEKMSGIPPQGLVAPWEVLRSLAEAAAGGSP